MLIGQITDIHIGFDRRAEREANLLRFEAVLDRMNQGGCRPDVLLLTGDLTEHGDAASVATLTEALAASPALAGVPVWPIPGNHDIRDTLRAAFPHLTPLLTASGDFIQYVVEYPGLCVVMLDTLEPGRHGGAFCAARAAWLAATLAARPTVPTLLALHHPPFAAGIGWMDTVPDEPWVARLAEALAGHDQIIGMVSGHVHRATVTRWRGIPAVICPSSAPAVGLDLRPLVADQPDGRPLIVDEAPGFALHRWTGGDLLTHFVSAGPAPVLAAYSPQLAPMIAGMLAERP